VTRAVDGGARAVPSRQLAGRQDWRLTGVYRDNPGVGMLGTDLPPPGRVGPRGERDAWDRLVVGVRTGERRVPALRDGVPILAELLASEA
jgi:hypothetical protein